MFLFLVALLYSQLASAEPKMCTQMGCNSGFHLSIDPQKKWPKGNYEFRFELDGKKIFCKGKLPLPKCERRAVECDSGEELVQIMESGCALPAKEHAFGDIHFPKAPSQISVQILRAGKPFASWKGEASYKTFQPNGEGCEPICRQAGAQLK